MAGAGIGNPSGAVAVFDFGNPQIVGGRAKAVISGGVFCFGSGADNVVTAVISSFVTNDLQFAGNASGAQFNGINLYTVGSNDPMAVATNGVFILTANGAVTAAYPVKCDGNNSVANVGSTADSVALGNLAIGKALTSAASGGYCLVQLR